MKLVRTGGTNVDQRKQRCTNKCEEASCSYMTYSDEVQISFKVGGWVLVGKPEGKRVLGRPWRRWVDNIRTDLQEVGCVYMDSIGLAQDRDRWRTLVSAVMNFRVP